MRNYFLIETAFTRRKFVFPPLEKNGQAHVAIATDMPLCFENLGTVVQLGSLLLI